MTQDPEGTVYLSREDQEAVIALLDKELGRNPPANLVSVQERVNRATRRMHTAQQLGEYLTIVKSRLKARLPDSLSDQTRLRNALSKVDQEFGNGHPNIERW